MHLNNKYALVLGASRGIGRAIARSLANQGVKLILTRFDWPEDCDEMEQEFLQMNTGHIIVSADLRSAQDLKTLTDTIASTYGSLHILINNIERGGMPIIHGSYEKEVNLEQWQLELDTTLHAKWRVFNSCLPLLKKAEEAVVVNISSIAGMVGRSGPAGLIFNDGYAAANRAITTLTETWARLTAPNIRVNEIMLGFIDTRHGKNTRGWKNLSEKERKHVLDHILLGRTGKPEEVADAVLFLVRDAVYMTGSVIRMDGGYMLGADRIPAMPAGIL
jgi:3-oxoacyl-[acyl-carrier protein] reductase